MYDEQGDFAFTGAGFYEINGNIYNKFLPIIQTQPILVLKIGKSGKWRVTRWFYGFEKADMATVKDITQEVNGRGKFTEKRVRAKR